MALDIHLKFRLIKTQITNIRQAQSLTALVSLTLGGICLVLAAWINQWSWLLLLLLVLIIVIFFIVQLTKDPPFQLISQITAALLLLGVLINIFSNQGNYVLSLVGLIVFLTYVFVNLLQNWTIWLSLGLLLFFFSLIPTSVAITSPLASWPADPDLLTSNHSTNFVLTNYLILITYLTVFIALLAKLKARLNWLERHYDLYNFGLLGSCLMHQLIKPIESSFYKTQFIYQKINKLSHDADIRRLTQELLQQLDLTKKIVNYYQPLNHTPATNQLINIDQCVQQCLKILEFDLNQNNIQTQINLSSSAKIKGSAHSLHQVLLNLIVNAVESFSSLQTDKKLSVTVENTANKICIEIRDNGRGMTSREIKHLPEAFSSNKQQSGLGFYLANQIIQHEFKGKIKVKSKLGHGTQVVVKIPKKISKN